MSSLSASRDSPFLFRPPFSVPWSPIPLQFGLTFILVGGLITPTLTPWHGMHVFWKKMEGIENVDRQLITTSNGTSQEWMLHEHNLQSSLCLLFVCLLARSKHHCHEAAKAQSNTVARDHSSVSNPPTLRSLISRGESRSQCLIAWIRDVSTLCLERFRMSCEVDPSLNKANNVGRAVLQGRLLTRTSYNARINCRSLRNYPHAMPPR